MTTTRLTTFRRIVEAREGNTRRATHATTRQRRPLGNPPRAPLRTPLRSSVSVGSGEAREPKADVSAWGPRNPRAVTHMLACFARGSGLGLRGGKRQRIRTGMEGQQSYLANASPGTAKRARDRGGLDGALPGCVFSRRPLFLAFFPVRLTRDFLSSPTPAEEEEQVYAQLATLRDHLPTRYAPRRPGKRSRRAHAPPYVDATVRGLSNTIRLVSVPDDDDASLSESALGRNTEAEPRRESRRAQIRQPNAPTRV